MFAFLVILHADKSPRDVEAWVGKVAARALPWAKELERSRWTAPSGKIGLWTWSNERPDVTGESELSRETATVRLGVGRGTTCHIDGDRITCSTTLARQDPIYYATRGREIILANRALLVAFLLNSGARPALDLAALSASFANSYNSGGFLTDRTPFVGVHLAPPGARLIASDRGVVTTDPGNVYQDFGFGNQEPSGRFYSEVGDIFLADLQANASTIRDLQIGITGGKDSRLLGAALRTLGIEFRTYSSGFDIDPDVILGRKVAKFLGVPHEHIVPPHFESEFGKLLAIDARGEFARELILSDGMNFTVPSVPLIASTASIYIAHPNFQPELYVTTDGSEIWRGGYASRDFSWFWPDVSLDAITSEQIGATLRDIWSRNVRFLKREWREGHEKMVADWLSPCIERGRPAAAAERFYLEFEIGRRTAAQVTRQRVGKGSFQPFINGEILQKISSLHPRFRRDNYLHYNLTKRFAPGLELLPFESMRWGFEWNAPTNEADRAAWLARAPIPYTPQTSGAWPMYGAVGSDCWRRFYNELFCYDDDENVWSFLDREALLKTFSSSEIFTPQLSSLFWTLYGLSVMMSGDWLAPDQVPESLVLTRYEKPWAEIYGELCAQVSDSEILALDQLANGIAEYLSRSGDETPVRQPEARRLVAIDDDMLANARESAGQGFHLRATMENGGGRSFWRVAVESEPGIRPANSYIILPLASLGALPTSMDVMVRFCYRADKPSEGHCYLALYGGTGRRNLAGPVLRYGSEWQTAEQIFGLAAGEDIKRLEFLLGLPDRASIAEIDTLSIDVAPRPKPPKPSVLAHAIEQNAIDGLRAVVDAIAGRYKLSDFDAEHLLQRAGLEGHELTPSSPYEFARFDAWVAEACSRQPSASAVAARLTKSREHWRFLQRCIGLSNDIRSRLLASASGAAMAPQADPQVKSPS